MFELILTDFGVRFLRSTSGRPAGRLYKEPEVRIQHDYSSYLTLMEG